MTLDARNLDYPMPEMRVEYNAEGTFGEVIITEEMLEIVREACPKRLLYCVDVHSIVGYQYAPHFNPGAGFEFRFGGIRESRSAQKPTAALAFDEFIKLLRELKAEEKGENDEEKVVIEPPSVAASTISVIKDVRPGVFSTLRRIFRGK